MKNFQAKEKSTVGDESKQSKSLEFLGLMCEDLNIFCSSISKEITAIKANLEEIGNKIEELSLVTEKIQAYSYGFIVKPLGIPELVTQLPCRQLRSK